MRAVTKIFLGVGAFLAMSGGLLALAGWGMGGQTELDLHWNGHEIHMGRYGVNGYNDWNEESVSGPYTTDEVSGLPAFGRLEVDLDLGDVAVVEGEDYGVSLAWRGPNYDLRYTCEDGVLKVWSVLPGGVNMAGKRYDAQITVTVPAGTRLDEVDLTTALGDVQVENVSAGEFTVESALGDVTLTGVEADEMDLTLSLGALSGDALRVTKTLTVENAMGDVFLSGDLTGKLKVTDSMGDVELITSAPLSSFGYDLEVSMGELTINGDEHRHEASRSGGPNYLEAENDMGDLWVSFG